METGPRALVLLLAGGRPTSLGWDQGIELTPAPIPVHYSYRNASIGSSRAARFAG